MGRVPTVSDSIRTQAHTADRFNDPSSLIYGFFVIPETVSERSAALTAASNSVDEVRFSPRLKARIFERKFDTVVSV